MPIRVLLADHHLFVRHGIRLLLENHGIDVVGEAGDTSQAVVLAARTRPCLVLVDAALPHLGGLEAARQLRSAFKDARIILIAVAGDDRFVVEALRTNVCGFVQTTDPVDEWLLAIRNVSQGGIHVGAAMAEAVRGLVHGRQRPLEPLSPRERQLLQLVAEGKTTREAGAALGIAFKTAEYYRTRLMRKLNVHSTAGLVRYALQANFQTATG
jgi:DNA-binding NarL/FixJ family response regulator